MVRPSAVTALSAPPAFICVTQLAADLHLNLKASFRLAQNGVDGAFAGQKVTVSMTDKMARAVARTRGASDARLCRRSGQWAACPRPSNLDSKDDAPKQDNDEFENAHGKGSDHGVLSGSDNDDVSDVETEIAAGNAFGGADFKVFDSDDDGPGRRPVRLTTMS